MPIMMGIAEGHTNGLNRRRALYAETPPEVETVKKRYLDCATQRVAVVMVSDSSGFQSSPLLAKFRAMVQ